jgi:hypothetical protein
MKLQRTHVIAWSVGALTAAVLAGGVAYATIPDANGKFNGCVTKTTGALRLVDATSRGSIITRVGGGSASCAASETPVSWSSGADQSAPAPDVSGKMFRVSIGVGDHRTVAASYNGIVIRANCTGDGASLTATGSGANVQYSGAMSNVVHIGNLPGISNVVKTGADVDYTRSLNSGSTNALAITSKAFARFDGLITANDTNKWVRLTMMATYAVPCSFWGVLTPVTALDTAAANTTGGVNTSVIPNG